MNYKLLTPGPLTTSETVKKVMMVDHCTWDNDYKVITQKIRKDLLELANAPEEDYTVILMQGSGTFGVESVITSSVGKDEKLLICENGAYGKRMKDVTDHAGIDSVVYSEPFNKIPCAKKVEEILNEDKDITHVSIVHCETTSGILNDIEAVAKVVKEHGKTFIVDAMSSFGGVMIDMEKLGADFMISSSNKCIQGVPGFSFIIAKKEALKKCEGKARSLALDLYDQFKTMDIDGKWRFTSPTHVVLAFAQAVKELQEEGGIAKRYERYLNNNRTLIAKMEELGIKTYIDSEHQSPIITTFLYPEIHNYSFKEMYEYIKERGYAIYPGKVTEADTFRIGNIGEIYEEDMIKLAEIIKGFMEEKANEM